jgi:phage tail-like protein
VADQPNGGGNGGAPDEFRTFQGAGFGTLLVQLSSGPRETPAVASSRAYLRGGLPAVYQEGDFGMRFIGALETLLDPIVAVLDALPAHFSADHAPRDILDLLSSWLGVELNESQTPAQRREMVRQAAELSRRRGTRAGIELALQLAFPQLPLRVEDLGGVHTTPPEEGAEVPAPGFIVYCDKTIAEETQAAVARCIEQTKPVHTTFRLRVRAPKRPEGEQA